MSRNTACNPFSLDPTWAASPEGELARMIGAGDPNEVVAGATPVEVPELDK